DGGGESRRTVRRPAGQTLRYRPSPRANTPRRGAYGRARLTRGRLRAYASSRQVLRERVCHWPHTESSNPLVSLQIERNHQRPRRRAPRQPDCAVDRAVFDADEQGRIALAQESASRGQPRHAEALLDQRIDGGVGGAMFGDKYK